MPLPNSNSISGAATATVGDGGGLGSGGAMTTGVKLIDDDAAPRVQPPRVLLAPAKQHMGLILCRRATPLTVSPST